MDLMKNLILVDHPILRHSLTILRDRTTDSAGFRRHIHEIARLLAYEASRDLATGTVEIETPLAKTQSEIVSEWRRIG